MSQKQIFFYQGDDLFYDSSESFEVVVINPSARGWPSIPATYNITVDSPYQITLNAGSLTFDGTTYTWPDLVFQLQHANNPADLSSIVGWAVGRYYDINNPERHILFFTNSDQVKYAQFYNITQAISSLDPRPAGYTGDDWTIGFGEAPLPANWSDSGTGSGSGDPFITPML